MGVFPAEVSQRHANELILMALEGAGWHRAQRLQIPSNMKLVSLPTWSPQLNPVEHLWDDGPEKWFANRVFAGMKALEDQLVAALMTLEADPQGAASLTGFDWISSISLNAN